MKTNKIFCSLLIILLIPLTISVAQISGISGGKLCVPDASALSTGSFEFEPSFAVFNAASRFCDNGSLESLSGRNISSSVLFRVTAGVAENLEIGTAFSASIEQVSVGSKYILAGSESFHLALIAGVSFPAGNKFLSDTLLDNDNHLTSTYGSIATLKLAENSTLDLIFSYTRIHGVHPFNNVLSYGIGIGKWFSEKFQGVVELNGFATWNGKPHSNKLSLTPGITYKVSPVLLFVFGTQFDLLGKNEDKGFGYFSAFTITF